jgi:hypothetical protein
MVGAIGEMRSFLLKGLCRDSIAPEFSQGIL